MTTPIKFAVLLKPSDNQPALDRAAQYAAVNPDISVVAVRIINDYKDDLNQIKAKENSAFELLKRRYASIRNFELKLIFSKNVAEAFNEECKNGDYSLAVISANKRHALKDLFVSNIDSQIMRQCTIPLLVVKAASATATLGQSVILAIDFTDAAQIGSLDDLLFDAASRFAKSFDGTLQIANCVTPENTGLMGGNLSQSKIVSSGGLENRIGVHYKLAEEFAERHGISLDHVHVIEGRLDEEIPRLCEKLNARMVCMGTTPRSTFLGSMNSSAGELVLEQIRGDIFIVNSEKLKKA
ncbi:MAG: universal stress protein [Succinivibrio sp.]